MNLYLISQDENNGYDTYDSAVVAAESIADAKKIHPSPWDSEWPEKKTLFGLGTWASSPSKVSATLIGVAKEGTKRGVICSSFNAG